MADLSTADVETTGADNGLAHRVQYSRVVKKSMWQALRRNPKVLLIAFFASYVPSMPSKSVLTSEALVVWSMGISKVCWGNLWS